MVGLSAWYDPFVTQPDLADSPLERARDALRRHAWQQCYELFSAAEESAESIGGGPCRYGRGSLGQRPSHRVHPGPRARLRGFRRAERRGDVAQAIDLFADHLATADMAVAGGWYSTAQRLLADQPECAEHGMLTYIEAFFEELVGRFDRSADFAQRISEIGTRFGNRDLQMYALLVRSKECVRRGRVSEAVPFLDEAMAAAISGELRPSTSRDIYCTTVGTCQNLADFRRAGEWTEATERCNARESIVPYRGTAGYTAPASCGFAVPGMRRRPRPGHGLRIVEGNDFDSGKAMA